MDFLQEWTLYERIRDCYAEHGAIIIAYDIDDTVRPFRSDEEPCKKVRELLKECKKKVNAQFIVFSSNRNIEAIKEFIKKEDLPCDFINENATLVPSSYFNDKKIYFHVLLDDKTGLANSYKCLKRFVDELE